MLPSSSAFLFVHYVTCSISMEYEASQHKCAMSDVVQTLLLDGEQPTPCRDGAMKTEANLPRAPVSHKLDICTPLPLETDVNRHVPLATICHPLVFFITKRELIALKSLAFA